LTARVWWLVTLVTLGTYMILFGLWLMRALIALPVGSVARLSHHYDLATRMIGSLGGTTGHAGPALYRQFRHFPLPAGACCLPRALPQVGPVPLS
jgi:hypothetical protein